MHELIVNTSAIDITEQDVLLILILFNLLLQQLVDILRCLLSVQSICGDSLRASHNHSHSTQHALGQ